MYRPTWTYDMVDESRVTVENIYFEEVHNKLLTKVNDKQFSCASYTSYDDLNRKRQKQFIEQLKLYKDGLDNHTFENKIRIISNTYRPDEMQFFSCTEKIDFSTYLQLQKEQEYITNQHKTLSKQNKKH